MDRQSAEHGTLGEDVATQWLRDNGFEIADKNWRDGRYELDIVATHLDTVHFIEVKCRGANSLVTPEQTLTAHKAASLRRAVAAWLALHDTDLEPQIDLIAIDLDEQGVPTLRYIPEAVISRW